MKKYAILLALVIIVILSATGCSKQEVEWQTITYNWIDDDGIDCKATLKVSPWINTKNVDYINAAWSEVGNGNELPAPTPEGWNLKFKSGKGCWRPAKRLDGYEDEARESCDLLNFASMENVYYCIGEISISTDTDTPIWLSACQPKTGSIDDHTMSRTLVCFNDNKVEPTWAKIDSNRSTFVFAYFGDENESALSEMTSKYFYVTDADYYLWEKDWNPNSASKLSIVE